MLKKGFTLAELIGVIVILGLISLVSMSPVLNALNSQKDEISDASKEIIYSATNLYVSDNSNSFSKVNGNTFCLTLDKLTQGDYLPDTIYDAVSGDEVPLTNIVEVKYEQDRFSYNLNNECVEIIEIMPNEPVLVTNMIPIKYNGTDWVYADTNEKWYDYVNKEWANAVVLNDGVTKSVGDTISESEIALWYVWIPRYKYQLFNANNGSTSEQLINIRFETGTSNTGMVSCVDAINQTDADGNLISETCTNAENGNWYTHPAFTFGDEELTGFWVGKFEVSGTLDEITIKPNVSSLRNQTASAFFDAIKNISTTYDISGDSHMIKNMEWGAVAYLSHSKYGIGEEIYINNSVSFYTGRSGAGTGGNNPTEAEQYPSESTSSNIYNTNGYYTYDGRVINYDGSIGDYASDRSLGTKASTTGSIYGVYDMSGGAWEKVMGNMVDSTGAFYSRASGFESAIDDKYYDKYTYNDDYLTHSRGKLGDATKEVLLTYGGNTGGWYGDYSNLLTYDSPWFVRGGYYHSAFSASAFSFYRNAGNTDSSHGSRAVLVP